MSITNYINDQIAKHQNYSTQDIFKLLYQASFGREHLLSEKAAEYLEAEYAETEALDIPLYERISDSWIRVNIASWKYNKLSLQWLKTLFFTENKIVFDGNKLFYDYLDEVEQDIRKGVVNIPYETFEAYKLDYLTKGLHPVHHSDLYRETNHPHYRLMPACFSKAIDILAAIKEDTKTIVIDGRAASGKTTVANILQKVLNAPVIHMDDFFLPMEKRSEERLSEKGGNIDYERFFEEVVKAIGQGDFEYGVFDCSVMEITRMRRIESSRYLIVEGSYSQHPYFGDFGDIRVFSDVSAPVQRDRILNRNGEAMLKMFESRWIPMEEKYFSACGIKNKSDLII